MLGCSEVNDLDPLSRANRKGPNYVYFVESLDCRCALSDLMRPEHTPVHAGLKDDSGLLVTLSGELAWRNHGTQGDGTSD